MNPTVHTIDKWVSLKNYCAAKTHQNIQIEPFTPNPTKLFNRKQLELPEILCTVKVCNFDQTPNFDRTSFY